VVVVVVVLLLLLLLVRRLGAGIRHIRPGLVVMVVVIVGDELRLLLVGRVVVLVLVPVGGLVPLRPVGKLAARHGGDASWLAGESVRTAMRCQEAGGVSKEQ
jgi:hypothetical protein